MLAVICVIVSLIGCLHCSPFSNTSKYLRTKLLTDYEPQVRPDATTQVSVHMVLVSLNDLNTAAQSMSLTVLWATQWYDDRLVWNPASYSDTDFVIFSNKELWLPPIVAVNEVHNVGLIGSGVPVRCTSTGKVTWIPPTSLETSCAINIANYPFDTQTCTVNITGWTYGVQEVGLYLAPSPISLIMYTAHGEWELIRQKAMSQQFMGANNRTHRNLQFSLSFRRRWKYYGLTLLLPLALSSLLMPGVFAVPVESGEKIGYSLTVLLSFTVLLTLISESIPQISTQTSALQIYLTVVLNLSTLVTLLTILILWLYHRDNKTPVTGLPLALYTVLAPFACIGSKRHVIRVQPADSAAIVVTSMEKDAPLSVDEVKPLPKSAITWQDFSKCIDAVCLRVFVIIFVALAILFITYLYGNYYSKRININL